MLSRAGGAGLKGVVIAMKRILPTALIALSFCGVPAPFALAQSTDAEIPEMPAACSVTDASEFIRAVVCDDPAYGQEEFIAAGRAACGEALPCGAWIWRDAADAPEEAPDNHDGLTQDEVTSASGVWVAEQKNFISIEKVKD
ncbi:hypothetical protein AAFO92_03280 [Roseovarius sp. CAU 1744]|uniref:hypothetical protein n=1 Tax=Roseovarius sp. CAU 1744 TaxID=3140368 RepID=UPI00325A4D6A